MSRPVSGDGPPCLRRRTTLFEETDRPIWGPGPPYLGSGTALFGVRDRPIWGPGPPYLGSGTALFGVRDRPIWGPGPPYLGSGFRGVYRPNSFQFINLRREWSVLTLNSVGSCRVTGASAWRSAHEA